MFCLFDAIGIVTVCLFGIGGAVGYSNNGTIKNTSISNTKMILQADGTGVDDWLGDKGPCQGYVVGHQEGGTIYQIGKSDCTRTVKNYDFRCGGFLCFADHNENYFSGNQDWGWAGKVSGSPSIT